MLIPGPEGCVVICALYIGDKYSVRGFMIWLGKQDIWANN
jgi:hypothetical protein